MSVIIGRVPWKFLLHILLVILTSAQVTIITQSTLGYSRAETKCFYYWFLRNDVTQYNKKGFTRFVDVFELGQLNATLRGHVKVAGLLLLLRIELLQYRRGYNRGI